MPSYLIRLEAARTTVTLPVPVTFSSVTVQKLTYTNGPGAYSSCQVLVDDFVSDFYITPGGTVAVTMSAFMLAQDTTTTIVERLIQRPHYMSPVRVTASQLRIVVMMDRSEQHEVSATYPLDIELVLE